MLNVGLFAGIVAKRVGRAVALGGESLQQRKSHTHISYLGFCFGSFFFVPIRYSVGRAVQGVANVFYLLVLDVH